MSKCKCQKCGSDQTVKDNKFLLCLMCITPIRELTAKEIYEQVTKALRS